MGKCWNLVRFLDNEAFPIDVKCDFGAFVDIHLLSDSRGNTKSKAVSLLQDRLRGHGVFPQGANV